MSTLRDFSPALPLGIEVTKPQLHAVEPIFPRLSNRAFYVAIALFMGFGVCVNVFINLQLSQGSFVESAVASELRVAQIQVESLQQQITQNAASSRLRELARELGMVEMKTSAFLSLKTGKVSGTPSKAQPEAPNSVQDKKADSRPAGWLLTNDAAVLVSGE